MDNSLSYAIDSCRCEKCGQKTRTEHYNEEVHHCIEERHKCCIIPEEKIDPNNFKWFIVGKYISIEPFRITPSNFTRGITTVQIDPEPIRHLLKQSSDKRLIVNLEGYRKRKYMPKKLKPNFIKQTTLDGWKFN